MSNTVDVSLDDIRTLQKRTRDKEYRLRKQGASQASIDKRIVVQRKGHDASAAQTLCQAARPFQQEGRLCRLGFWRCYPKVIYHTVAQAYHGSQ